MPTPCYSGFGATSVMVFWQQFVLTRGFYLLRPELEMLLRACWKSFEVKYQRAGDALQVFQQSRFLPNLTIHHG